MFGRKKSPRKESPRGENREAQQRREEVKQIAKMLQPSPKELVSTPRAIVKYGSVNFAVVGDKKPRKFRFLFLFNNALLITKKISKSQFRLRYYIVLRHDHVVVDKGAAGNAQTKELCLVCPRMTFSFEVAEDQKEAWKEALEGSIRGRFDLFARGGPPPSVSPSDAPPAPPPPTPPNNGDDDDGASSPLPALPTPPEPRFSRNLGDFDLADFQGDDSAEDLSDEDHELGHSSDSVNFS